MTRASSPSATRLASSSIPFPNIAASARSARASLPSAGQGDRRPHRRTAAALRSQACRGCAAGQPAARHQAEAAARSGGAAPPGHPDPRRADVGRRPDRARRLLAHADRPVAGRWRHDFPLDAFHERSRALRPHLADACGQSAGGRNAGGLVRRGGQPSSRREAQFAPKTVEYRRAASKRPSAATMRSFRSGSIRGDSGPTPGARPWSCCATRSG